MFALVTAKTIRATAYRLRLAIYKTKLPKKKNFIGTMLQHTDKYNQIEFSSKLSIVNAFRQLVSTTLLVEFSVMQFTIDLQQNS